MKRGVCHPPYPAPCGTLRIYPYLGFNEPFICRLVDTLAEQMGGQYPDLSPKRLIVSVIREEESAFAWDAFHRHQSARRRHPPGGPTV